MNTFADLAAAAKTGDLNAVSDQLTESELVDTVRADLVRDRMIEVVLADPEILKLFQASTGLTDKEVLRRRLTESFASFPADIKANLLPLVQPAVDAAIEARRSEWQSTVRELVRGVYGQLSPAVKTGFEANYRSLLGLGAAWRDRDGEKFDQLAREHLATVNAGVVSPATQRGMQAETLLNRAAPFYLATLLYLLAALTCFVSWIGQRAALGSAATTLVWLAIGAHGAGILLRMIVTGRPPVTNLHGSFLFVSFAAAIMLQILERWTRMGACTLLGALFGTLVLLWAWSVSINDGDTMAVLVAVLDTQFWLSTHVICISLGYVATIVAGLLGLLWVLWSLVDAGMTGSVSRRYLQLVYGTTAFALLLSFFGTVLGGLWGDDSWGRFWGWDPKENGALMIVLWNAVVLHARWAGVVRDRGIAALAIFGIVVTIWSWECVNQLGVGLHSYGVSASRLSIVLWVMASLTAVSFAGLLPRWMWNSPAVRGKT
jgi:ABC-type transport system involved in cytochrome c biogenesis permease subunit